MRVQFASGRQQLPFAPGDVVVAPGSSNISSPVTLYFAIQGQNPAGLNLLSDIVGPVAIAAGDQVDIVLPAGIHLDGEYWLDYVISASATNIEADFVQIAKVTANPGSLPITVSLTEDAHLALLELAASEPALPTGTELLNGMLRGLGLFVYEYDADSAETVDGDNVLAASAGRWIKHGISFSTYLQTTTEEGGCDRPLKDLDETLVRTPRYAADGSNSEPRVYWLRPSVGTLPAGERVGMVVSYDGAPRSGLFEGHLRQTFRGYANTTTGALRTVDGFSVTFPLLNAEVVYTNQRTDLVLPDELANDEAYTLEVSANFKPEYLRNRVAQGALISVEPFLYVQVGAYSEIGFAFGDWLYRVDGEYQRVCVPGDSLSLIALRGSGMVARRSFTRVGPDVVSGLATNTAAQELRINGNGSVFPGFGTLLENEAIRCYAGTEAGVTAPSAWSAQVAVSGTQGVDVLCTYPKVGDNGQIRADYPDTAISGNDQGVLNAPLVTVYLELDDGITTTIKAFSGLALLDGNDQTFSITDWNSGTTIGSVPSPVDPWFGLYAPVSAAPTAISGGNFPVGQVRAAFAFEYDGTAVTTIDHTGPPAIYMAQYSLAELESFAGRVKVSSDDTAAGYLQQKLVQGPGIWMQPVNPGGNEVLQISSSSPRLPYDFSVLLTPGASAGQVRLNNADPSLATELYVSKTDASTSPRTLAALLDNLGAGTLIMLSNAVGNVQHWFEVTLNPVDTGAAYTFGVTPLVNSASSYADGDPIDLYFSGGGGGSGSGLVVATTEPAANLVDGLTWVHPGTEVTSVYYNGQFNVTAVAPRRILTSEGEVLISDDGFVLYG